MGRNRRRFGQKKLSSRERRLLAECNGHIELQNVHNALLEQERQGRSAVLYAQHLKQVIAVKLARERGIQLEEKEIDAICLSDATLLDRLKAWWSFRAPPPRYLVNYM